MKQFSILLVLSFFSVILMAQNNEPVEQYCDVTAVARILSNKVTINIDYGEERSIWKNNRLKDEEGKIKKFNTVIDALNFMGKNGWKLVNAFPVQSANEPVVYHYVFKKAFSPEELEK